MTMPKAQYYKTDGKKGRARALPEALFDGVINEGVLHQVIKAHLANQRQGNASAKTRSEVQGGSRKPWRQKGTGRARQGSIRSVQWVGGGRAFPPQPHSWRQRVPKKLRALARRSAYNVRADAEGIVLYDGIALDGPKTRTVREYLETIGVEGKVLFLTDGLKRDLVLSTRNMPEVIVREFGSEAPYDILWAQTVLIERSALDALEAAPAAVSDEADDSDEETDDA
ncbi:MAG: 50S ribosomal protein L4 [Gemmatimonadales bacterium]|nr:MAG: 50S ribosomal protein L4 [Gemmatimonadales bacterium]